MKGIRKLFLGFILLTLFGVAFKVDAKAGNVPDDAISNVTVTSPTSWSGDTANFTVGFDVANTAFPDSGANQLVIQIKAASGAALGNVTIDFTKTGGANSVSVGTLSGNHVSGVPISVNKSILYPVLAGQSTTLNVTLNGVATPVATATVTATPVAIDSKYVDDSGQAGAFPSGMTAHLTVVSGTSTYNVGSTYYFLPGDVKSFSAGVTPGGGYAVKGWYINGSPEAEMASLTNYTIPSSSITLGIYYKKNPSGLTLSDIPTGGVKVAANHSSLPTRTYTLGTGYDRTNISKVRLGGIQIADPSAFTTGGIFSFTTDRTGGPLTVEMTDGQVYEFPITVVDAAATISVTDQIVHKGSTVTAIPTITGMEPDSVSYSPASVSNVYSSTVSGYNMVITGLGAGPITTVTASAHYDNIEGLSTAEKTKTATFKITPKDAAQVEFAKNVFVNKGNNITVKLKDFLKYDADVSLVVNNNSGGYISISPSTGSNLLSTYTISGSSKGTKEKGISFTPGATGKNEATVTVYPEPTISLETSSTSSSTSTSTTYAYSITMPKGVYHDEPSKWVDDLKKAILIFKSSSSDGKTKEVVYDSLEKNDDYSKKQTKKIDVKTITGYLRDICKNDEETVSVWACAVNGEGNNDDKVKTDSKDLKVYKIVLDTNGNKTTYTVNGDTVYDYFYKIDGVEYTVVAKSSSGSGKVDKKNSVNADNATESTGTATIKLGSSGSGVAGERKIKVAFSASSTPADDDSGSGSGGLDDQPKTGESKADIWILWTVLFISILGAGFMIWKRFGLVRAIAEADDQVAAAEFEEKVNAAKKEKEDKIKMLKDLRNL